VESIPLDLGGINSQKSHYFEQANKEMAYSKADFLTASKEILFLRAVQDF